MFKTEYKVWILRQRKRTKMWRYFSLSYRKTEILCKKIDKVEESESI